MDDTTCVNAIVANLEGEAAKWVTALHDGAPKLGEPAAFLREIRGRSDKQNPRYASSNKGATQRLSTFVNFGHWQRS